MPLEINFDFKAAVFRPGDVITGYVTVFLTKPFKSDGVVLDWSGQAYTNTKQKLESQVLFRTVQILHKEAEGDFPKGESRLDFRQRLPTSLPPSYVSKNNHAGINFKLEAKLKLPGGNNDLTVTTEKMFYVVPNVELTENQRNPVKVNESSKSVACCCWWIPNIDILMSFDYGGYSPGEEIKITTIATNNSKHTINELKLDFVQIVSFDSSIGYYYQREVVRSANMSGVTIPSEKSQFYLPFQVIRIPPLPPTCGYDSNKFKFSYVLQLYVSTPTLYRDMVLTAPIKLGIFPFGTTPQLQNENTLPIQGTVLQGQAGGLGNLTYMTPSDNFYEVVDSSDEEDGVINNAFENISLSNLQQGKTQTKPKYPFYERQNDVWIVRYQRVIKEEK